MIDIGQGSVDTQGFKLPEMYQAKWLGRNTRIGLASFCRVRKSLRKRCSIPGYFQGRSKPCYNAVAVTTDQGALRVPLHMRALSTSIRCGRAASLRIRRRSHYILGNVVRFTYDYVDHGVRAAIRSGEQLGYLEGG